MKQGVGVTSNLGSPVHQVSDVQRKFVEKLLENSVFNKHLTAVREINNMLQRAKDVRANSGEPNAGKPMKVGVKHPQPLSANLLPSSIASGNVSTVVCTIQCSQCSAIGPNMMLWWPGCGGLAGAERHGPEAAAGASASEAVRGSGAEGAQNTGH